MVEIANPTNPASRVPVAPQRSAARRAQILQAALQAFERRGLGLLTVQDVADAAGVAKSVVLYHFRDRPGLLRAVAERVGQPQDEASALLEGPGDPREHLNRWLSRVFELATDDGTALRLGQVLRAEAGCEEARGMLLASDSLAFRRLEALLARGHGQYCWHAADATRAALLVRAVVDGLLIEAVRSDDPAAARRLHGVGRAAVLDLLVRR